MKFRDLKLGQLFTFPDYKPDVIWCKTPFADMMSDNNPYNNADGAFCTAIRVNSDELEYMQCSPNADVIEVNL